MQTEIEHLHLNVGDVALQVIVAGPADGDPLIFLHGFPEFSYAWHAQIEHFAQLGYRVLVPDQRGFGDSDKPKGVANYHIDKLAGDIVGLADVLGYERFNLVGHDWGGIIAWHLLSWHAERLQKVVLLNAPHLSKWKAAMRGTPAQALKSWYVFAFQLPFLPERLVSARGGLAMFWLSGLGKALNAGERARYRQAYDGAMPTMMNWYRAALRYASASSRPPNATIDTPVLMLWGKNDRFLSAQLAHDCVALCSNAELEFLEDASHWLIHEQPARINAAIQDFLQVDP